MKPDSNQLLLPFYFGTIEEPDRLFMERELLSDSEVLVDYLDLKRKIEFAEGVPSPSAKVWYRLAGQVRARKRIVLPFSIGLAFVTVLVVLSVIHFGPIHHPKPTSDQNGILFDSSSELPANSNVL